MSENPDSDRPSASPYVDINNPFQVGAEGAEAEYLLKNPQDMPNLAVGAKAIIEDERQYDEIWFSGRVKELEVVSPFQPERQKKLYLQEDERDPTTLFSEVRGPHSHEPMVVHLELEQELEIEDRDSNRYQRSAVQRPPSIESRLYFPQISNPDDIEPSLRDILQIKTEGIPLGAVGFGNKPLEKDGEYLIYRWDLENLDIKHTFVVGESGSGKTVLLKRMGLHIRDQRESPVIFTDVQGDIVQVALPEVATTPEQEGWQAEIADKMGDIPDIEAMKPFKIVVPESSEAETEQVQSLRTVAQNNPEITYRTIGLRLKDIERLQEVEYLFSTQSPYASQIIEGAIEELENELEMNVSVENVKELLQKRKGRAAGDKIEIGTTEYMRSSVEATLRGAISDLDRYFDNDPASLSQEENPLNDLKDEGTIILYLDHLNKKERIMYEMQMIQWLYNERTDGDWNPYVFIDEAHQVIPETTPFKGAKDTFERLKTRFEQLAREGRKYNMNLILSTQSPQDIAKIVNDQCHTRIVMKSNEKNSKAAELYQPELQRIADRFGKGQFFIKSPFNDTSEWLRLHSWIPDIPHEDMDEFRSKLKEEAKRVAR